MAITGPRHRLALVDNRPLLNGDKPELRRYTAVYMLKDKEVSKFSQDLVMTCSP